MKTFIIALLCVSELQVYAFAIVVPSGGEGNTSSIEPFSYTTPIRYQQVYGGSRFIGAGGVPPEGGMLRAITFRLDSPGGRTSSGTYDDVRITVSTTLAGEGSLSPVFMENVGADAQMVFSGSMTLFSLYARGREPQAFDVRIALSTPFFYDPTKGNLLFDYSGRLSIPGPNGFGPLDAFDLNGDTMASVFSVDGAAPSGEMTTRGLTTLFEFDLIPEPSALALLAVSAVFVFVFCRRRKCACR